MTTSESHSSGPVTIAGPRPLTVSATNPRYFTAAAGDTTDRKAVYLTRSHIWNNLHDGMDRAGCVEPQRSWPTAPTSTSWPSTATTSSGCGAGSSSAPRPPAATSTCAWPVPPARAAACCCTQRQRVRVELGLGVAAWPGPTWLARPAGRGRAGRPAAPPPRGRSSTRSAPAGPARYRRRSAARWPTGTGSPRTRARRPGPGW